MMGKKYNDVHTSYILIERCMPIEIRIQAFLLRIMYKNTCNYFFVYCSEIIIFQSKKKTYFKGRIYSTTTI